MLGPAVAAGSVFTFSLSLGDYITVQLVGGTNQMLGNLVYTNFSTDLPFAAAVALLPLLVMAAYLLTIRRTGAVTDPATTRPPRASRGRPPRAGSRAGCDPLPGRPLGPAHRRGAGAGVHLRAAAAGAGQLLLHQRHLRLAAAGVHAALVAGRGVQRGGRAPPCVTSVQVALGATAIAVVLGTLAAMALVRHDFFGRDMVSLLVLLPIALPGIVTGIALNTLFTQALGGLTFFTLVAGHATFCIVIVVNNASARLRRMSATAEEASTDLGATPWTTWRLVTFPALRGALLAGALLAFALSFDEIIVTTFTAGPGLQTLPLWIFQNLFRPNQSPIVNVAAVVLVVVSVLPVYLANRLSGDAAGAVTK